MIFCKRKPCTAGSVTEFDMQLTGLKWKVKNFTDGDIYVSVGSYAVENSMRIAAGSCDVVVDRDPQTGTRKTSRRLAVFTEGDGEVEVMMV
ncbi:MAG: hypothetical protein LUE11_03635 [Clostridia bacterium]|nr:hypothetical protein [Clostridia bacterium]